MRGNVSYLQNKHMAQPSLNLYQSEVELLYCNLVFKQTACHSRPFLVPILKVPITRIQCILNFEHSCSLKNFCQEIKVILHFNTLLSKDEIGNLRLISRHNFILKGVIERPGTKCL